MIEVNSLSVPFIPAGGVEELTKPKLIIQSNSSTSSFSSIFNDELNKVKFSAHAQTRLNSRDIELTEESYNRLEQAVTKANDKGAKESLILLDDNAFIVSVANRTVITAVPTAQMKDNIITNIDSAVIA